ncbi:daunorubicin resistance protein DrrA family ABC transporter ATP-binding protein [Actinokineospora fastidiosa]|uniref:Daunorubicin resistance protein DrrA family ABC transporter ATP-binding protein n=2 Tax=Actinokineospora fastidiosa TaxID=1816 RepID=A0A918GMJ2_9PSEU|nr:daunorubicin resistance protein DrrA family ABC transporter ATP-binding protein [Actinokineospora fastidiosa]
MMRDLAVFAEGLTKSFGSTPALRGLDLAVPAGTVCGLLGPNGAGKTTAVRVLTTLLVPDSGTAFVDGVDVVRDAARARYRFGLVGQAAALDEAMSGRANLRMFGRLYHLSPREARRRADDLLERFDLADAADREVGTYSGGMRRRLDLAAGLLIAPAVLFLDEPTTGLDPRGRSEVWAAVRDLVAGGTAVVLTTQYLDEADRLADSIAVVDAGRVVATGTPDELKARVGAEHVDVVVASLDALPAARTAMRAATGMEPVVDVEERSLSAQLGPGGLAAVVRELDDAGVRVENLALRKPTLDEVFLEMTEDLAGATR